MKNFYSNGKLLITGEYVILDGAIGFAVPTKFGQNLIVSDNFTNICSWESYDYDGTIWFKTELTFEEIILKKISNENHEIKNTLIEILYEAHLLNPNLLLQSKGFAVTTLLTFPRNWGLGTSSTLINNIAQWFQVDAFELLKNSFGGSGYDIACAQNYSPILYQSTDSMLIVTPINFRPPFSKYIYFVYLNQKQNSKVAIFNYRKNTLDKVKIIEIINRLSQLISTTNDFAVFESALKQHEIEISDLINEPTIQQRLFSDYEGTVKSLGAWGGDFIMVLSKKDPKNYFKLKGFNTVLKFSEIIL